MLGSGGVWCSSQVLNLVRRRRSPARRPPTEPSPSTYQSHPLSRQSRSEKRTEWPCLALGGLTADSYWDFSRGMINPGLVTWESVYVVARPETPNDLRLHHWWYVPVASMRCFLLCIHVHEIVIVLFLTNVQHNVANNSLSSALIFLFDFDFSPGSGRSHQYREPDQMDVDNCSNTLAVSTTGLARKTGVVATRSIQGHSNKRLNVW